MKNYKGWSGGFAPTFASDAEFQTFLTSLNYTESFWLAMNVNSAVPIGLPSDRYLMFINITNATRGYLLAYPHTGTKIYRRALTGSGWGAWTIVNEVNAADLQGLQTQISELQNQVNDHLGYGTYFVSGQQTALDLIFDNTVTATSGTVVRLTYCNGMITMFGTIRVNNQISPGINVLTQLTNDFLPGTGGIVQFHAGYTTEIGIGYMEGARISANIQTSIPPSTNIEFRATFPCSKGFSYIDNLLADYKIPY